MDTYYVYCLRTVSLFPPNKQQITQELKNAPDTKNK